MRQEWLAEQDRRRRLVAAGYTAALYLAAFLAAWGVGLFHPRDLADLPGAVMISLDSGEGPASAIPLGLAAAPERPAGAAAEPPAPAVEEPVPASAPPNASARAVPRPAEPAPAAKSVPIPKEEAPTAAAASPAPAPVAPPAPASRSFGSAPTAPSPTAGVVGGSGSVTFRGSEKGNSLDTTFGASSGTIGRSLYVPIYSYMPLPSAIGQAIYQAIPGDKDGYFPAESRKSTFRQYYQPEGDLWRLKAQVPLERRQALWFMLEDAGYDLATADYKAAMSSDRVVVEFAVGPSAGKANPVLVDVQLIAGSGSPEVDKAVLYGFERATFFNKNAFAVSGKFVYRFGK